MPVEPALPAKEKHDGYLVLLQTLRCTVVPGIFASSPAGCASKNVSCPLDSQAKQIVIKLDGFFEWAKQDSRIAGFNPWQI